jgi:hypothetical protein
VQNFKVLAQVVKHFMFVKHGHHFCLTHALGMHVLLNAEGDEVGDVFVFLIHSIRFMAKVMILY